MSVQPTIVADFETQLSVAIAVGDVSFTLNSNLDDDGIALPSGLYYFTLDNGTGIKEYLTGTLAGSAVSGVKSVSRQGVETSGAVRAHRVGASVIITDFATYKKYIDNATLSGAVDASTSAKGIVQLASQAQILARTASGSVGPLVVTPDKIPSTLVSDYVADTGSANAYAIAPTPAIVGYVTGQVFTFKATNASSTVSTLNVSGLGVKTIKKIDGTNVGPGDIRAGQIVTVEYDGTNFQIVSGVTVQKFGGSGVDGALAISSGTTTIDLGGVPLFIKNYTSISITGTAKLAFTNHHANGTIIIIKSQGNVTLSSATSIDVSGMGALGATVAEAAGNDGLTNFPSLYTHKGNGGTNGAGAAVAGATLLALNGFTSGFYKTPFIGVGAGGGSGSTSTVSGNTISGGSGAGSIINAGTNGGTTTGTGTGSGLTPVSAGGDGGGGLVIECAGTYTNTSSIITAAGLNGATSVTTNISSGGGGAGGCIVVLYNVLGSDTGTYTVAGGTGGTGGTNKAAGGNGGLGFSFIGKNTEFV